MAPPSRTVVACSQNKPPGRCQAARIRGMPTPTVQYQKRGSASRQRPGPGGIWPVRGVADGQG